MSFQPFRANKLAVQLSSNGKCVRKLFSKTTQRAHEYACWRALHALAPVYGPKHMWVTDTDALGPCLTMDYVGEELGTLFIHGPIALTAPELALGLTQCIEVIQLLGNDLRLGDVHPSNVCFEQRGAKLSLRFIDYEVWQRGGGEEANVHALLQQLWVPTHSLSSVHLVIANLVYFILHNQRIPLAARLLRLAFQLRKFVKCDDEHQRAWQRLYGRIQKRAAAAVVVVVEPQT